MNSEQKFFLMHGGATFFMLGATTMLYLLFDSNVFILAIGWAGMFFMSEYFHRVRLHPITLMIGRSEGAYKTHKEYRKLMKVVDKALRTNRRR